MVWDISIPAYRSKFDVIPHACEQCIKVVAVNMTYIGSLAGLLVKEHGDAGE
jgi:hypothetical protein